MDQDLRDKLVAQHVERNVPMAVVAFDAIEAAHGAGRLAQLVEAMQAGGVSEPGGLFARPRPRQAGLAKSLVELRMLGADVAVIDDLVQECRAENRSQLIIAALREYLV